MQRIRTKVYRFDPAKDAPGHFREYEVEVADGARVLHVLHAIHEQDPGLEYRHCCGTGQCGSCALRVDDAPVLACLHEAKDGMILRPLDLPVQKDLVIDMGPALARIASLVPAAGEIMPRKQEIDEIKPLRSCIECLACVSICPAVEVAEFTGPTTMRQEMRLTLDSRDGQDRITQAIQEGLFTCTTCQYCWKVCPKDIQIPGKAIEKLRAIANRRGLTLPRHREIAQLIRETGRSVPRTQNSFLEQVSEVIEPAGEVKATVGFFVGCMYNLRLPQTALDATEVMRRNGIRIIIPQEQICCGSPLIRTGQITDIPQIQEKNIRAFVSRGIDRVLTMCAGCGSTLKNDYSTPFQVVDINELLCAVGIEQPARLPLRAAYHDPCHLLRGQGIRDEPRRLLSEAVSEVVELPVKCCGAGGGTRSGMPQVSHALAEKKAEEIEKTGVDTVVSSCPFCEFHIRDHTDHPVQNITSILLEGYRKKDGERATR
jgi:fumarate reductase (CoM/CoB) subunit B